MSARARVLPWKMAADRVADLVAAHRSSPDDPWLTMDQAGAHLGYTAGPFRGEVARQFIRRSGIHVRRRGGRVLLVRRSALDAFVETGVAVK